MKTKKDIALDRINQVLCTYMQLSNIKSITDINKSYDPSTNVILRSLVTILVIDLCVILKDSDHRNIFNNIGITEISNIANDHKIFIDNLWKVRCKYLAHLDESINFDKLLKLLSDKNYAEELLDIIEQLKDVLSKYS